jgi:hypothetical protein
MVLALLTFIKIESAQFNEVLSLLTSELSHVNATVRTNAQKSLQLLSDLTKTTVRR